MKPSNIKLILYRINKPEGKLTTHKSGYSNVLWLFLDVFLFSFCCCCLLEIEVEEKKPQI